MKLEDIRREYESKGVRRNDLDESPFRQFESWLQQAMDHNIQDPTAMVLATIRLDGGPWQRTVLLKHYDDRGFVFYTNLGSGKAQEMAANLRVSLLFPWLELNRQIIVAGEAKQLSSTEVLRYFITRPRDSQLAAWASRQSHTLSSRQVLEQKFAEIKQRFANGEVPLPSFWGGYRVCPQQFEFWQGRRSRLHDRFRYTRAAELDNWTIARLAP